MSKSPISYNGGVRCDSVLCVCGSRNVFIKSLLSEDEYAVGRFELEGYVSSCLSHPLILQIIAKDSNRLVFPFVEGGSLRSAIELRVLSVDEASSVAWGILCALRYMHEKGIVHHDLKPENILLDDRKAVYSSIRVADFGMCYAKNAPKDIHEGSRMGTPHFMPPEQFNGVRGDPRSDLYSVGAILFDCLTGKPPYADAFGWLVGSNTQLTEMPSAADLHDVILRSLHRDPAYRPQNAAEMLEMLADARTALGLAELPLI